MNIPEVQTITFPATAVPGDQLTRVVTVTGAVAENVSESATFTATLGSDTVSAPVSVVLVAPSTPTFTVTNTASVSFEITSVNPVAPGTYQVTVVATKL